VYKAHAINVATGAEKPNFPVTIQGSAANDPSAPFEAKYHLQRPGLLLMNGVVYAAFGGLCDVPPYRGWIAGVNASTGAIASLWTDEALVAEPNPPVNGIPGGGIWQTGGHLINDNGDILFVAGNGVVQSVPTPGKPLATNTLGESAIRLKVLPGGGLQAVDFFSPCNAQRLSDDDQDLGSGAPLALPDSFGTNPHLVLVPSKEGTFYLLNRDDFGGFQQGSGSCPDGSGHAGDKVVSTFKAPDSLLGVWATPAAWPGDGGLIYVPYPPFFSGPGKFTAYRITPGPGGKPTLSIAGQSNDDPYGFGSSSAIITSDGTSPGSGLAWLTWFPAPDGVGAELRAYDANPAGGVLTLRGRWPIGQGNKFTTPTVRDGRIYVGTRDGNVRAFGVTGQSAANAPAPPPPARSNTAQVPDREG
jgi:hypothetical protein